MVDFLSVTVITSEYQLSMGEESQTGKSQQQVPQGYTF